jgi:peptidoglycan/xylan/chitin deacetylase (PgdA/CDA1 family)
MKILKNIGLISLFLVTFVFSEKLSMVVKENDDIMVSINENADMYEVEAVEATIVEDTIIPGVAGLEVDKNKSYNKMREKGFFNFNLFEYKVKKPKELLKDNLDKYIISANESKNMVSLIFLTDQNTDPEILKNILYILNNKEISANFFIDGYFLEDNNDLINEISKNHVLGNLSYNNNYEDSNFVWLNTIIRTLNKKYSYCYMDEKNEDYLKICALNNNYTIYPSIIAYEKPLTSIKSDLKSGSLIALKVNSTTSNELSSIIDYIKSKGYKIDNLVEILKEDS